MDFRRGARGALAVVACAIALIASNHIAAQTTPQTIATYTNNAKGQRTSKTVGGVTTRFSYDEAGHLIGEYSPTGSRDYIYVGDILVNTVDTPASPTNAASTSSYVTTDQKGTPRAVSDSTGNVIWQNPYQGNAFEELDPTSNGYTLNMRGPGEYFDVETGLNYNGQRYRDTSTWRFMQADPKGLAGGIDPFVATDNDPLNRVDPTGLQTSMEKCLYPQNAAVCAAAGMLPQGATSGAASAAANTAAMTAAGAAALTWSEEHAPDKACPATGSNWDNGNRDECEGQRNRDESECGFWHGTGPDGDAERWYRACMVRAADRFGLCMKGSPTMPPPWGPHDID